MDLWGDIQEEHNLELREPEQELKRLPTLEELMELQPSVDEEYHTKPLIEGLTVMGIDVSNNSTGLYIHTQEGEEFSLNLGKISKYDSPFEEVLKRRELKQALLEVLSGISLEFDRIVLEDVFVGRSNKTARALFSLNTAIDELILDGAVITQDFQRVNNLSWKSVWSRWVSPSVLSRKQDKELVQNSLKLSRWDAPKSNYDHLLDLNSTTKGSQDRLDAFAMVTASYLGDLVKVKSKPVPWAKVRMAVEDDLISVYNRATSPVVLLDSSWSKETVRKKLSGQVPITLATDRPVLAGFTVKGKNLTDYDPLEPKYLMFWVDSEE